MTKQALPGKRKNAFEMDPDDLVIAGIDTEKDTDHPLYDERCKLPVDQGMVTSIIRYGVLEPVLVRKNGDDIEVVDGRQRVRAARLANEKLAELGEEPKGVLCVVRKDDDATSLGVMVAANELRVDDDPLTKAKKAQRLIDVGYSHQDVAETFGVTRVAVSQWLKLLELDPKVHKLIKNGIVSASAAATLVDLPPEEQAEKAQEYADTGVSVTEARRAKRERQTNGSNGESAEARGKRPSARVIKKLIENEDFLSGLSDDARHLLFWFAGEESRARRISGLTAFLREIEG